LKDAKENLGLITANHRKKGIGKRTKRRKSITTTTTIMRIKWNKIRAISMIRRKIKKDSIRIKKE
jgi:hypothetical protein